MSRIFRLAFAVIACAGLLSACGQSSQSAASGEMDMGDPNSKVTLVEYASVTCIHCARFDHDVFPAIKAKYIDTKKIHYVFKEFLTAPAEVAASGFVLARCAAKDGGKERYFQVIEALFRAQDEMFQTQDYRGPYLRVAKSVGMSEAQFNTCLNDEAALNGVQTRMQAGIDQDKINGTPTFIINGKQVASGEVTEQTLATAIDTALKAAH